MHLILFSPKLRPIDASCIDRPQLGGKRHEMHVILSLFQQVGLLATSQSMGKTTCLIFGVLDASAFQNDGAYKAYSKVSHPHTSFLPA
jgi:hypothetical protein